EVQRRWRERVPGRPLPIVMGECWLANNVACYGTPRPTVYPSTGVGMLTFDERATFWVGDADVRAQGAALLWDADAEGAALPAVLRQKFPAAECQPPMVLPHQCAGRHRPARIGVAF